MCLLLIAVRAVPDVPLLLLGNRDEYHERASAAAAPWPEDARVAGGRDLVAGGTWLAVRSDGRFASVTNLRTGLPARAPRSRGALVRDFVLGDAAPEAYLAALQADVESYGAFNLVVGDARGAFVLASADAQIHPLEAGLHVVSNGPIGIHWPKTERLQQRFAAEVGASGHLPEASQLLDLLCDEWRPPDAWLPDTGVGIELERLLSPIFIRGDRYGTRASTLVAIGADGRVRLHERRFGPHGVSTGESRCTADSHLAFALS